MMHAKMLAFAGLALASAVFARAGHAEEVPETTVKENRFKFSLPDLEGKTISDTDERFKGKVLFVDIWGTWCPPCRKEIPVLVGLYEKYREKGLEIVGIAFEKEDEAANKRAIEKFAEENKISYPVLYGGRTAASRKVLSSLSHFRAYPTGIFIGRDGVARKVEVGYDGKSTAKMIEAELVKLLEEKPGEAASGE